MTGLHSRTARSRPLALAGALLLALGVFSPVRAAAPDPLSGRWLASAEVGDVRVPFRLDLKADGGKVSGTFFDGPRPANPSAAGSLSGNRLHLEFPSYAATLDATVSPEGLDGEYVAAGKPVRIRAVRDPGPQPAPSSAAPDISGEWVIPVHSPKGETGWRLIIHQTDAGAEASILRIDGDTGTLDGAYHDGVFHLSHFAGERAARLDIARQPDGSLALSLADSGGTRPLTALRPAAATALGAIPSDPTGHTSVRNPDEPLRFAFPDLGGKLVTEADPRFRGKVVLVNLMGSWCPNCHDEAPFLQALYSKHAGQGLEIVALDFEKKDQLPDLRRLKAFLARYGIGYTVLLAGEPAEVNAKVPQAVNLNAWPTTFFLGRDGKVRSVHVGFTSPGSGARDTETRAEIEAEVSRLLAEPAPRAAAGAN